MSERELEILKHVAAGNTSAKIAEQLNISKHTVDNHRKSMLRKTGAKGSLELVLWATKNGVLR